jgi:hypothetical protein
MIKTEEKCHFQSGGHGYVLPDKLGVLKLGQSTFRDGKYVRKFEASLCFGTCMYLGKCTYQNRPYMVCYKVIICSVKSVLVHARTLQQTL